MRNCPWNCYQGTAFLHMRYPGGIKIQLFAIEAILLQKSEYHTQWDQVIWRFLFAVFLIQKTIASREFAIRFPTDSDALPNSVNRLLVAAVNSLVILVWSAMPSFSKPRSMFVEKSKCMLVKMLSRTVLRQCFPRHRTRFTVHWNGQGPLRREWNVS